MQVILKQSVAKLGKKFETLEVSDGYAMNYLFPQGLAERATPARIARLDADREATRAGDEARRAEIKEKLETLRANGFTMAVKADVSGHLYKKIHEADIALLLAEAHGIVLRKESITIPSAITQIGEYDVAVQEFGVDATVKLSVRAE